MLKKVIAIILIIMLTFLCISCSNKADNENATIQIWYYDYKNAVAYSDNLNNVLANIRLFCERSDIPVEIIKYDKDSLSYEDYILKRNIAAANGNMIIIDDVNKMWDIAKHHADYTKLENYDNLFSIYKDNYCIPLGVDYNAIPISNKILEYYNISTKKPIITYDEYLKIKQDMKEKGAKLKVSGDVREFSEIIDYYLNQNGLMLVNEDSEILRDNEKLKKSLKNAIIGVCDDFIMYNDSSLKLVDKNRLNNGFAIYDDKSELILFDGIGTISLTDYTEFFRFNESILDTTLVIHPRMFLSPCFYMYKKITNDKIYDLANYIVSDAIYVTISGKNHFYSPIFETEKTKNHLELDSNWEYNGAYKKSTKDEDIKICNLINDVFEMLVKDNETSKLISSYYYTNWGYNNRIIGFVADLIRDELSIINFDYKNKEANKMIDNKIDEFIKNFNVLYN